ncbi:hypothetical protein TSOC_008107 [Tetrabaena socialis]|uniref:Uncharacterized protein n=1 Tax=Tetrabaena socialis TaxID=47790 RepID=A0A2J7ZZA3_9CHLO|nr:hypothetical protein TSOC_008107 [Tetrabaena socialis]|eukprot:PNH05600.1 hypothetical protein TSOC_008107 [Tetrabaena socialis]
MLAVAAVARLEAGVWPGGGCRPDVRQVLERWLHHVTGEEAPATAPAAAAGVAAASAVAAQ